MEIVHCQSLLEEAKVISLIIRGTAGNKKIALVTYNQKLARMTSLFLKKWDINLKTSSTLLQSKEANFLLKILQAAEQGPTSTKLLFMPKDQKEIDSVLEKLKKTYQSKIVSTKKMLEEHIETADKLDKTWLEHSQIMQEFILELKKTISKNSMITPSIYKPLLISLLKTKIIPAEQNKFITITTPMEARLLKFDKVILADLNEGSWPPKPEKLSEKNIGQSHHDFVSFLHTKEMVVTRNNKTGVTSRWLVEIEAEMPEDNSTKPWLRWAQKLEEPDNIIPCKEAAAKPPRAARPKNFSVSDIRDLITDPYSFYAKKILKLKEQGKIEAKEFGIFVHKAFDTYTKRRQQTYEALLKIGKDLLSELDPQENFILWWHRFKSIAEWFVEHSKTRKSTEIFSEIRGECEFIKTKKRDQPWGEQIIMVTAICDRLEISGNKVNIIDYKTGTLPSKLEEKDMLQLAIEEIIAQKGGFLQKKLKVEELSYWDLRNQAVRSINTAERIKWLNITGIMQLLLHAATDGRFPATAEKRLYSPYSHLARIQL
jgi:hypothetical protein